MRSLSLVQGSALRATPYEAGVRTLFIVTTAVLAVLFVVPPWTGEERVTVFPSGIVVTASPVTLDPRDPARTRVGTLTFLGGVRLASEADGFGGFSALAVTGERFTLLSDSGNVLRFRLGRDWRIREVASGTLPAGPGRGWEKSDRDSESLAIDAATHRAWIGFEHANEIWRYTDDLARTTGHAAPAAMRRWPTNGGAEALARLPDGRFVAISEEAHVPPRFWSGSDAARLRTREALIFPRDPLRRTAPVRFAYVVDAHYDVADATALPDGDLLVLERRFRLPYRFSTILTRVAARDVRAGAVARRVRLATLDAPLIHDNFEGIATTREGGATILWLVSDDNQSMLQRTLLLKFRLEEGGSRP